MQGGDYCSQRATVQNEVLEINYKMEILYNCYYIHILNVLKDKNNMVKIFIEDCTIISQDTRHLTKSGAIYIGKQIDLKKYIIN